MRRLEQDYGRLVRLNVAMTEFRFALSDLVLALHVTLHGAPLSPNHHPTCKAAFEKRTTT